MNALRFSSTAPLRRSSSPRTLRCNAAATGGGEARKAERVLLGSALACVLLLSGPDHVAQAIPQTRCERCLSSGASRGRSPFSQRMCHQLVRRWRLFESRPACVRAFGHTQARGTAALTPLLPGAEFYTKGSLKRANFKGSNLEGVTLFGADLSEADFRAWLGAARARLPRAACHPASSAGGANLRNSNLGQSNLTRANLSGVDCSGAIMSGARCGAQSWAPRFFWLPLTRLGAGLRARL